MTQTHRHGFLHGFASSALSRKGTYLARYFQDKGIELELPDLNRPSFEHLTYTGALEAFDLFDSLDRSRKWCLAGSSMGGYLAARWAELHPERMHRLVLLCPGFNMHRRWPTLVGPDNMARWEAEGSLMLPGPTGDLRPVGWQLVADALTHPPVPEVPCPTLIIHGSQDEIVPIESSRRYAGARDHVELLELDDDHPFNACVAEIADAVDAFFACS